MSPTLLTNSPNRLLQVASTNMQSLLTVTAMVGADFVSAPFSFDITGFANDTSMALSDFIMQPLAMSLYDAQSHQEHVIHGIIDRAVNLSKPYELCLTIKPWLAQLQYTQDCRSYQNLSVVDIIQQVFKQHLFFDFDITSLQNTYPKLPYIVQYNESYFHFISRLMEQAGIFYYFTHTQDKHIMHLADSMHKTPLLTSRVVRDNNQGFAGDHIYDWHPSAALSPEAFVNGDYNPELEKPLLRNATDANKALTPKTVTGLMQYHYPGDYEDEARGQAQIRVKARARQTTANRIHAASNNMSLVPGTRFRIQGDEQQDPYFITERHFEAHEHAYGTADQAQQNEQYGSSFSCINTQCDYAPPQVHDKPVMAGIQTAVVTGPDNSEIYHDANARIKLQFHWDHYGQQNEHSSPWIRVAQRQAGSNAGHFFNPRVGEEALVTFIHGNPDRPMVIGSAYNSNHKPAYALPEEKASSGIKTHTVNGSGHNELTFSDQANQEKIFIKAQHQLSTVIENDASINIQNNMKTTIDQGDHQTSVINGKSQITATNKLHLQVKGSTIEVTPAGITINAALVTINPGATGGTKMPSTDTKDPSKESWIIAALVVLGLVAGIAALVLIDDTGVAEVAQGEMAEEIGGG